MTTYYVLKSKMHSEPQYYAKHSERQRDKFRLSPFINEATKFTTSEAADSFRNNNLYPAGEANWEIVTYEA